jgi:hypothetical protein
MLTKNPNADHASANVKRAARRQTPAPALPAAIHEPKANWAPLWQAPFYCFSNRYIDSPGLWAHAFDAKIQQHTSFRSDRPRAPDPDYPELIGASPPKWS